MNQGVRDYGVFAPPGLSPWIPTLLDIEKRKADGEPLYQGIGFEELACPVHLSELQTRWEDLRDRFNERYAYRMINSETLERWQVRLQNRFDEIAERYNRAYKLYAAYDIEMLDEARRGWIEKEKIDDDLGGSDLSAAGGSDSQTTRGTERNADTPDSANNANENYADSRRDSTGSRTDSYGRTDRYDYGRTRDYERETVRQETGEVTDDVNRTVDQWRDLDTRFVMEFENLFLNIFW